MGEIQYKLCDRREPLQDGSRVSDAAKNTPARHLGTANAGKSEGRQELPGRLRRSPPNQLGFGTSRSLWAISSIDTSRKVRTLALFTKRAGRYMSQTQASPMETS